MEKLEPKEKALEIYDKMKGFRISNRHRMKCALVAVQQTQNELMIIYPNRELNHVRIKYWEDVLKELEIIKDGFPTIKRKKNVSS
jgi:hypothetical protein